MTTNRERLRAIAPSFPDLSGKVALVTGGSRGIGAATALALAGNGVHVGVAGLEPEDVERVASQVREAGSAACGIVGNLTDAGSVAAVREAVETKLGVVDILICFAGGVNAIKPMHAIPEDEWRDLVDSNLTSTYLTIREFLPGMIERRRGSVVTMGSNVARQLDSLNNAAYVAAKAGIVMLSRHLAREVAPHGIRVNCVCPATTHSERVDALLTADQVAALSVQTPLGRMGEPEDTAYATLFFSSDAASWITGATLDVAGGRSMM